MIKETTNNQIIIMTIGGLAMIILNKITTMIIKIQIKTITPIKTIIIKEEMLQVKEEVPEEFRIHKVTTINTKRKKNIRLSLSIKQK